MVLGESLVFMDTIKPMGPSSPAPTPDLIGGAAPPTTKHPGTYELVVILPATFDDNEIPRVKERIGKVLSDSGLAISAEEDMGKRKLAFPINHIRQGFYHLYKFEGPRSAIRSLDQSLRLMPEVLRHLITSRKVRTQAQLEAENALRERIQAKRIAAEEQALADRHVQEAAERMEKAALPKQTREVSKEELEKKLEEILTDENLGT